MEQNQNSSGTPARDRGRCVRATIVAAGAALGMTLAGLGISAAQTSDRGGATTTVAPGTKDSPGAGKRAQRKGMRKHVGLVDLGVAAKAIGISEADLREALRSGQSIAQVAQSKDVAVNKVVDALVADARTKLPEHIAELVNRTRHHGPGGPGGRHHPGARAGLSAAAKAIGVSESDLLSALRSGQSIAQVAESKGVEVQKVIDAIVAEAKTKLAAEVETGDLTQAEADERAARLTARVTGMVERTGRRGPGGGQEARALSSPV